MMLKQLGCVALLFFLQGCYLNKAMVDPYSYAPASPHKIWKPRPMKEKALPELEQVIPAQDTPLTLAELVDIALRNNTQTQISWAQARAAAASYGQSQSTGLPNVSAAYNYSHQRTPFFSSGAKPPVTVQTYDQWGPQLMLSYTLLDFGLRRATSEAARYALYFSDWMHNRTLQTLIQTVANDYYNYLFQKQLLTAYIDDMSTAQATLDATRLELEVGVTDVSDYLQAQTSLIQTQTKWVSQQGTVHNMFAFLLRDMGLPATLHFEVEDLPKTIPTEELMASADELLQIALNSRPDLMAAKADLLSKEEQIKAAKAQYWPNVTYNYTRGRTTYTHGVSDGCDFNGTLTLNIPIFSGYFYRNGVRIAQANREESFAQLKQKETAVIQEITTSHFNVKIALETLKYAKAFLEAAKEQYGVTLMQYKEGVNTILDVLNAQAQLSNARANQANAMQGWFSSLVNLTYATGILTETTLPQPTSLPPIETPEAKTELPNEETEL